MDARVDASGRAYPGPPDTASGMASAPFSSLLRSRPAAALLSGLAALQLGLAAWGLPGWSCPLLVWGWMNAARFNLRNIMLIWTIAIVVSIIASFMGAPIYSPS